jgi:glutaredoxin
MILKVFTQPDCPNCLCAKKLVKELTQHLPIEVYDIKTEDGLGEALMYNIMSTPSLVLVDKDEENPVRAWVGKVPTKEEVLKW